MPDSEFRLCGQMPTEFEEFKRLLATQPSANFLDFDAPYFTQLMNEIVPAYTSTAVATDGVAEWIVTIKFGLTFENLLAALRADKCDLFIHTPVYQP